MSATEETISLTEAAEELGVHYMTVYRHVRTGRLPATRLPVGWSINRQDLDAYRNRDAALPLEERQRQIEERLLNGDDAGVWTYVESALASAMPAQAVLRDLLIPSMRSIGQRWRGDDLSVLDEHRATSAMTVVLARLGPHVARITPRHGTVVVGTPANDTHALAATMLAELLRTHGFTVIELGAATPPESFAEQVVASAPIGVVVSVNQTAPDVHTTLIETVAAIRAASATSYIAIGGPGIGNLSIDDVAADAIHSDVELLIDDLVQREIPTN